VLGVAGTSLSIGVLENQDVTGTASP